jgi:uncharacterized RDD family membrane protein YckC
MEQAQSPFEEFKPQAQTREYAGFWLRVVAVIIDAVILWPVGMLISYMFGMPTFPTGAEADPETINTTGLLGSNLLSIVINWLYYALMESSAKQATVGKMALKLKVTDMDGNRIGFGQATGRYFGKIISSIILFIGFIMAGFTEKKQALHDIMAGTLVVKKDNEIITVNKEEETY